MTEIKVFNSRMKEAGVFEIGEINEKTLLMGMFEDCLLKNPPIEYTVELTTSRYDKKVDNQLAICYSLDGAECFYLQGKERKRRTKARIGIEMVEDENRDSDEDEEE